jgi:PAS domain S-box-containing protein
VKILLIEDNIALADNFIEIFSGEGFEVFHARTGEEAQRLINSEFLLFVIDLRLPDTSGLSLLQSIKKSQPNSEAILLTGDADISSAIEAVRAGAFAYLLKPVSIPELLLTVERAAEKIHLRLLSVELEAALRHSEERYRSIVEMVPALIVALDRERSIVFANNAVEGVSGYTREALTGKKFDEIFSLQTNPNIQEFESHFTNHRQQHFMILWRWTQATSSLKNKEEVIFYVGTDVTHIRRLERERQVAERLAVVGKMTAGLAHEIRNPLNAALLQLALLSRKQEKLPQETSASLQRHLGLVQSELERLNVLLADFLSLAKPKEYQKVPIPVDEILHRVISLQQEVAQQRDIKIHLQCPPKLSTMGDQNALQQVFLNLFKNALEAARSQIDVSAYSQEDRIHIKIKDDGPGISKEAAEHIFEPFFTTKAQGTGLGLVIVHSIILAHGGSISITSPAPGEGAVALVQLPCL